MLRDLQLPLDRPPKRARLHQPDGQIAHLEYAVPHLLDGDPEAGLLRAVRVAGDRRSGIAEHRNVKEVGRAHLGGSETIPPGGDEGAPARALAVGGLHHLVEIAEEAGNARDLEHAADDVRPVLE